MSIAAAPPTAGRKRKPLLVKPSNLEGMEEEERYKPIEWSLVRRLLTVLAPYKKQYLFGLLLGLMFVTCDLTPPKFMQHLIDYVMSFVSGTLAGKHTVYDAKRHVTMVILIWAVVS